MVDIHARARELSLEGRCCAQVMVRLALEERGEQNEQMADAVGALCGGLSSGLDCGALSGAAVAMWVLAGEPVDGEIVRELVEWFAGEYGATACEAILAGDPSSRRTTCPPLMIRTYEQAREVLDAHGLLPF